MSSSREKRGLWQQANPACQRIQVGRQEEPPIVDILRLTGQIPSTPNEIDSSELCHWDEAKTLLKVSKARVSQVCLLFLPWI